MEKTKAVFLDRDGVINELVYYPDHGIVDSPFTPAQFRLLPGVPGAIKSLQGLGYRVILVSNQPGIAKGHFSRGVFEEVRQRMHDNLGEAGVSLDGEYYCFHHPEAVVADLQSSCGCRKPKPGLLLQAAEDLGLDLEASWMVGDGLTDIQAGKRAGSKTVFLGRRKCESCTRMMAEDAYPDAFCADMEQVARMINVGI